MDQTFLIRYYGLKRIEFVHLRPRVSSCYSIMKYIIVYNLTHLPGFDFIMPSAFICNLSSDNKPMYIKATAISENISSYIADYSTDSAHGQLIAICRELSVNELEKYFFKNRNRKKGEGLSDLLLDTTFKKRIKDYIDRRINKLLTVIREQQFYLCFNLERKVHVSDVLLDYSDVPAIPELKFIKTQTGVKYSLSLSIKDKIIHPSRHSIVLVANMPGIIILDNKYIVYLNKIDSQKLIPFIKDEYVFIPDRSVKMYFEKFVAEILNKVSIDAEGFVVKNENELISAELIFIFPFHINKWCVDVRFRYGSFSFLSSERIQRRHKIIVTDDNEIYVLQCVRDNTAESKYIDILKEHGFELSEDGYLSFGNNTYSIIEEVTQISDILKQHFEIQQLEIEDKQIRLMPWKVEANFVLTNDWFDLYGNCIIGDQTYPISSLFENIRNNNPFFKIDDGSYVIIPEELMTKYSQLVRFSKSDGKVWRLSKVHYTLMDESEIQDVSDQKWIEDVEYIPGQSLKAELRPYQLEGVKWLIKHRLNGMGALLADDMGLGKTLQTIAALLDAKDKLKPSDQHIATPVQLDLFGEVVSIRRKALNAIIILPATLVFNWYSELRKFAPSLQVLNYTGNNRKESKPVMMSFDVIVTTYQSLLSELEYFQNLHFHYVIIDESQQIRNKNSKIFQAVHSLSSENRVSLSGTPIENSLSDLWSQMEFINPGVLGNYSFFQDNFKKPIEINKDNEKIEALKLLIEPYILRRTKESVAKDLPELIEHVYYCEMTDEQISLYEREKSAARNHLAGLDKLDRKYRFNVLASILKLRQIANHPKMTYKDFEGESGKFEIVKSQIETLVLSGHKVLIFSSFLSHLALFEHWLSEQNILFAMLTGEASAQEKKVAVERFQNEVDVQVFLISIKAGGTGLNLTRADYVFILDPWWNPFVEYQAVARAHRIGRTGNVMVTRFISRDSIEERIMQLQSKKKGLSDNIIEVETLEALTDADLEKLLE